MGGKPRKFRIHFNKPGSKKGYPWTVHLSGRCIPARSVHVFVRTESVFKPEKKENPRAWIAGRGHVVLLPDGTVHIL